MKVTIDGIPVDVEPGTTILNAARIIAIIQSWKVAVANAVPVW